ncbi:MAG: HAMP domain-containing sensor histidine kinase [Pseudomonadota bacterium]
MADALRCAEDANATRAQLVAAMAHDLLQPLLGARLNLSLVLSDLPEKLAAPVRTAIGSLLSAEQMVEILMDDASLDSTTAKVRPAPVDLAEIIAHVCDEAEAVAAVRGLRLRCRAPRSVVVDTDQVLVLRLVRNLVSNAIRYTQRGTVMIFLRIRAGRPVVEVWDTGPGFQPGQLERYLADGDTSSWTPARGMGIGLRTVFRLARALSVELDARSIPGKGTRFHITFPHPADDAGSQPARLSA